MRPRYHVILRGGLGNQLFQTAAAAYFADKYEGTSILEDYVIYRHPDKSRRSWIRKIEVKELFRNSNLRMCTRFSTLARSVGLFPQILNKAINPLHLQNINILRQSNVLFDWFISKEFLPQSKPQFGFGLLKCASNATKNYSQEILNDQNLAAIHMRFGDFNQTSWGVLPANRYTRAIEYLGEMGISRIDCYSDDIYSAERIIAPLKRRFDFFFYEKNRKVMPHELLLLLSSYSNFISSNSTLSWWACYLNQTARPIIFAPWKDNLKMDNWMNY